MRYEADGMERTDDVTRAANELLLDAAYETQRQCLEAPVLRGRSQSACTSTVVSSSRVFAFLRCLQVPAQVTYAG
jgi:hypothetical protein